MTDQAVRDENGQPVERADLDYWIEHGLTFKQAEWEREMFRPTTDPRQREFQASLRQIEQHCLRAAFAVDAGLVSPRALERLRKALRVALQPSDQERVYGHDLRRARRQKGSPP